MLDKGEKTAANSGLAKVAVQYSADSFVVNQTLFLRINICGENRHLHQARNRQDVKKLLYHDKSYGYLSLEFSYIRLSKAMI